jgi:hypothetical protein
MFSEGLRRLGSTFTIIYMLCHSSGFPPQQPGFEPGLDVANQDVGGLTELHWQSGSVIIR